MYKRNIG